MSVEARKGRLTGPQGFAVDELHRGVDEPLLVGVTHKLVELDAAEHAGEDDDGAVRVVVGALPRLRVAVVVGEEAGEGDELRAADASAVGHDGQQNDSERVVAQQEIQSALHAEIKFFTMLSRRTRFNFLLLFVFGKLLTASTLC